MNPFCMGSPSLSESAWDFLRRKQSSFQVPNRRSGCVLTCTVHPEAPLWLGVWESAHSWAGLSAWPRTRGEICPKRSVSTVGHAGMAVLLLGEQVELGEGDLYEACRWGQVLEGKQHLLFVPFVPGAQYYAEAANASNVTLALWCCGQPGKWWETWVWEEAPMSFCCYCERLASPHCPDSEAGLSEAPCPCVTGLNEPAPLPPQTPPLGSWLWRWSIWLSWTIHCCSWLSSSCNWSKWLSASPCL